MNDLQLDPRAQKLSTAVKVGGVGLVAVAASGAVIVAGASVAVASVAAVAGLFCINFLVPVAARTVAVWKQKSLTAIAETFSEETIRDDERAEQDRVNQLQNDFIKAKANLMNAQDELREVLKDATGEAADDINKQIKLLQEVIDEGEATIEQRVADLAELRKQNKMYIAFHRAGKAITDAQGAQRNAEQIQAIETARNAIKTRMRSAMAGQKIAQINAQHKPKSTINVL
jgi:hypothetical protein